MFRLLDDYGNHLARRGNTGLSSNAFTSSLRSFSPRFDIKETKDAFELHGELPGIERKNVEITWTDSQTISIKGRTETFRQEGNPPAGFIEGESEQGKIEGAKSHQPTVEDESNQESTQNGTSTQVTQQGEQQNPGHRYWLTERSVGEFARSFSFPSRVDQDKVKASMKNGILEIVVPKAAAPVAKRINIE
jgi:HSP20 family molecular chaperone IbpA